MHPVYLFIGQSGAGKGTQIALLKEAILKKNPATTFFAIETGDKFRELIATDSYTASLTRDLMEHGTLPPPFLGVHMWAESIIENYDGKATVFIDGTPRVPEEVPLLLTAAAFYSWTYKRIKGRGRADDTMEKAIAGRIGWFHTSVEPAIELLRQSPIVHFHDIHGEQSIEKVHEDICRELNID
jgi:adenylate kinase family enzyme